MVLLGENEMYSGDFNDWVAGGWSIDARGCCVPSDGILQDVAFCCWVRDERK